VEQLNEENEGLTMEAGQNELAPMERCTKHSWCLFPQVEQLKEENEGLMMELVKNKMALAELSESYARVKRDLHRREAKDRAVSSKMSRMCVRALSL